MKNQQILVLSFSPLDRDPRVLRQIETLLAQGYEITAAGYTDPNLNQVLWWPVQNKGKNIFAKVLAALSLKLYRYRQYYYSQSMVKDVLKLWKNNNKKQFDLIIANDIESLPVALDLAMEAPVYFDAHEYSPAEFSSWVFRTFLTQYRDWQCRTYLPQASVMTTVCQGIANAYQEHYQVNPIVIHNAPEYQDLTPQPVDENNIRLVHHGVAMKERGIEIMIEMMLHLDDRYTLDFYLIRSSYALEEHFQFLIEYAENLDLLKNKINFCEPVAMKDIPMQTNQYDVGVFLLQPNNFNYKMALPNKFFEFVQARLAVAIGPSPEMQRLLEQFDLGVVAKGFSAKLMAEAISSLSAKNLQQYKQNADKAAKTLSFDTEAPRLISLTQQLLSN